MGDRETAPDNLIITLTSTNAALVPIGNIAIGGSGSNRTVTITPVPNGFGQTRIGITVTDLGLGNTNVFVKSTNISFVVTVQGVNDPPTFSAPNVTTNATATTKTFVAWAAPISAGPLETTQTAAPWTTTVLAGSGLFTTLPSVNTAGTLTFKPNGTPGTATVQVTLRDNGGTGNGGIDTTVKTFTITLTP
jgi:hypothetical protein